MSEERQNVWQFPVSLKLTIIWIYINSMFHFYNAMAGLLSNISIDIASWVAGFVFLGLANGLVGGSNSSRIWVIFWVSVGSLIRIYLLAILIIKDIDSAGTLRLFYYEGPMTQVQGIIFLSVNLVINAGVIFTLAKSGVREVFSSQTSQRKTT